MRNPSLLLAQSFVAALLFAPFSAFGQVPDGHFEFDFGSPIYDLSFLEDCESFSGITVCLELDTMPDGKGNHFGTAEIEFSGGIEGLTTGEATGRIKGSSEGGKAKFELATEGPLDIIFEPTVGIVDSEISVKCKGVVSPTGFLDAICKVKVTLVGLGSDSATGIYSEQLEGGPWTFSMDVVPVDEKTFVGLASDTLGFQYVVGGKYSASKDVSKVKAIGLPGTAGAGAKLQLKNLDDLGVAEAKFKVQGYKGSGVVQDDP